MDDLKYWEEKLAEFEEAMNNEKQHETIQEDMIRLLKMNIDECQAEIKRLKNV